MDAGSLRCRLQLECDDLSYVNGGEVRTPRVYATVWAEPEATGGGESWRGQAVASQSNYRFTIRYRTDVKPQHRVIFRGRRMEIVSVNPDEMRHSKLVLECKTLA